MHCSNPPGEWAIFWGGGTAPYDASFVKISDHMFYRPGQWVSAGRQWHRGGGRQQSIDTDGGFHSLPTPTRHSSPVDGGPATWPVVRNICCPASFVHLGKRPGQCELKTTTTKPSLVCAQVNVLRSYYIFTHIIWTILIHNWNYLTHVVTTVSSYANWQLQIFIVCTFINASWSGTGVTWSVLCFCE